MALSFALCWRTTFIQRSRYSESYDSALRVRLISKYSSFKLTLELLPNEHLIFRCMSHPYLSAVPSVLPILETLLQTGNHHCSRQAPACCWRYDMKNTNACAMHKSHSYIQQPFHSHVSASSRGSIAFRSQSGMQNAPSSQIQFEESNSSI